MNSACRQLTPFDRFLGAAPAPPPPAPRPPRAAHLRVPVLALLLALGFLPGAHEAAPPLAAGPPARPGPAPAYRTNGQLPAAPECAMMNRKT